MTTGTIVQDHRYSFVGDCGTDLAGDYYRKIWSGSDDPKRHKQWNSYSLESLIIRNREILWRRTGDPTWRLTTYQSCFGGAVANFPTLDANDELLLLTRLGSRVRNHDFNLGVFTGEARESLQMVSRSTRDLSKFLHALKSGDTSAMMKSLRVRRQPKARRADLNNRFLEWEFGWRPLVNDLYEAGRAVYSLTNRPISNTYKASIKKVNPIKGFDNHVLSLDQGSCKVYKSYRLTLSEDFSPWASLGLTSPAEVGWELLPFSFVADWALPIGRYMEARSFVSQLAGRTVNVVDVREFDVNTNYAGSSGVIFPGHRFQQNQFWYNRSSLTLSSQMVPRPTLKPLSAIFTWRHALDGLALLFQHCTSPWNMAKFRRSS